MDLLEAGKLLVKSKIKNIPNSLGTPLSTIKIRLFILEKQKTLKKEFYYFDKFMIK